MISRHPQGDNLPEVNVSPIERIASAAGGAFLIFDAVANKGKLGWVKALGGAFLLYRGTAGYCPVYGAIGKSQLPVPYKTINIRTQLTVNKPRNEVYQFWHQLENLPLFMKHLVSVEKKDETYSIWKAKFPGAPVELAWEAEIVKDVPGSFIGWSSTEEATIKNAGKVTFKDALGGRGTEIDVVISYHPPLGIVGSGISKLFNKKLEKMITKDIRNFKSYIETGVNKKAEKQRLKEEKTKSPATKKTQEIVSNIVASAAAGVLDAVNKDDPQAPAIGQF